MRYYCHEGYLLEYRREGSGVIMGDGSRVMNRMISRGSQISAIFYLRLSESNLLFPQKMINTWINEIILFFQSTPKITIETKT